MTKPINRIFRPVATGKERTRKSKLGQIANQTFEEEQTYLNERSRTSHNCQRYLPTPEQIAESAAIIREENYERYRLDLGEGRSESRGPAATYNTYRLDTSGMGARRGKLI